MHAVHKNGWWLCILELCQQFFIQQSGLLYLFVAWLFCGDLLILVFIVDRGVNFLLFLAVITVGSPIVRKPSRNAQPASKTIIHRQATLLVKMMPASLEV
eukprot:Colp12_sorted_trinity150504_noHs@27936